MFRNCQPHAELWVSSPCALSDYFRAQAGQCPTHGSYILDGHKLNNIAHPKNGKGLSKA